MAEGEGEGGAGRGRGQAAAAAEAPRRRRDGEALAVQVPPPRRGRAPGCRQLGPLRDLPQGVPDLAVRGQVVPHLRRAGRGDRRGRREGRQRLHAILREAEPTTSAAAADDIASADAAAVARLGSSEHVGLLDELSPMVLSRNPANPDAVTE